MPRFRASIQGQLSFFTGTFLAIILGLVFASNIGLQMADQKTDELNRTWFAGTVALGELADRLSEFRIAEGYRALAATVERREQAELLADEHRRTIEELQVEYTTLLAGRGANAHMEEVRATWKAFEAAHDAWIKEDIAGDLDNPAHYGSDLHRLYKAADKAVDHLIQMNTVTVEAGQEELHSLVRRSLFTGIAVSGAAILLGLWLLFRIRDQITRPLGAITRALSDLATGNRAVRVPALNRPDEIGEMANAFEVFRSNSFALELAHEATRRAQEEAFALARHDPLTGLPNRRVFSAELQAALGRSENGSGAYSVMLIDLDRFKEVNDLQGHSAGDVVLCEVARRLGEVVRTTDIVARLGGDEFAIIAEGEAELSVHLDGAKRLAVKLLGTIGEPIVVGQSSVQVGASIGIAICGIDAADAGGLLHAADIAMYRAKRDGRGTFRFFEQSMDEDIRAQAALEVDLRKAVSDGRIVPHYQPLVDIRDNRICGFEALARWDHPTRGCVLPDVFIPIIEQLGLMPDLTTLILRQACRDAREWPADVRLSVNISPSDLKDPLLPTRVLGILASEGLAPTRLDIEITETALVSDIKAAKAVLTALQASGIKISLDDFGTGYSSLYHLRELKFDKVKIDRSFVQAMLVNAESEKIVDAILGLTNNLNLQTVAEGIEDPEVLQFLVAGGCVYGQGYYFGQAMTADDATEVLHKGRGERVGSSSMPAISRPLSTNENGRHLMPTARKILERGQL